MSTNASPFTKPKEIGAGVITALFLIVATVSYSAAIFSGPLAPFLPVGLGYGLLGAVVAALVFAVGSQVPFAIGGPDSKPTAVLALMAVSVATSRAFRASASPEAAAAAALFVLVAAGIFTGLVLYALGRFRLGRWVRFVPFPVVGGFMAASGWLLIVGAIRILTGVEPRWSTLSALFSGMRPVQLLAGVLLALAVAATERRKEYTFPLLILSVTAIAHVLRSAAGISLSAAREGGWLLQAPKRPVIPIFWLAAHWQMPPAPVLLEQAGGVVALVVVTSFTLLLGITSIEVETGVAEDIDVDRELRVNGIANVCAGMVGGMAGTLSLSRTLFNFQNGARRRLGGILAASLCLATLAFGTGALGWVPVPILGGILLRLGFDLLDDWFIQGWKRMDMTDYAQVVIILFAIAIEGFIAGVALGVIAACVTFAINTSRVGLIKQQKDRSQHGSRVLRSVAETRELVRNGRSIQMIWLQGFIFFGSVNALLQQIRKTVARQGPGVCSMVILDFRQVLGIDSSSVKVLVKMRQYAQRERFLVVLSGLSSGVGRQLRNGGVLKSGDATCLAFRELDAALEWCEDRLLEDKVRPEDAIRSAEEWLAHEVGGPEMFRRLAPFLETLSCSAGNVLFAQGEPADFLCLIASGRVSVILRTPEGDESRLRSMHRHTIVGEMGLYRTAPRGARVVIDHPTVVYRLAAAALERMEGEDPALALAFHRFVVRTLADRLDFANREISASQT